MNSGVASNGSPAPTSHRLLTTPALGGSDATTVVTNRKSFPSSDRAAAATNSFWVDAGANDPVGLEAYSTVAPSAAIRPPVVPAMAPSSRTPSRTAAGLGVVLVGAGAVVVGAVGAGPDVGEAPRVAGAALCPPARATSTKQP